MLSKEIGELIRGCMDGLPVNQREAFVLREVEGLETSEVCKILTVSITNFGVLMHRARARLRECLEAKGLRKPEAGVGHDLVQKRGEAAHVGSAPGTDLVEAPGGALSSRHVQILLPLGPPDGTTAFGRSRSDRTGNATPGFRRPSNTPIVRPTGLARCLQIPANSWRYAFVEQSQHRQDNHGLE